MGNGASSPYKIIRRMPVDQDSRTRYRIKNALRRLRLGSLAINAKQILRAGCADQEPAYLAKIDLDAIHVFAPRNGPVQETS